MRRRLVLLSAVSGALSGALTLGRSTGVAARQATSSLADHPMTGTWVAMANPPLPDDPQFPAPSLFSADGTVLLVFPTTQVGPEGVFFNAPVMGTWEADSDRRGHFTAIQLMSAADGTFLGSIAIDGYPEVSADGQTLIDDGSRAVITIRDAAGTIVNQVQPTGQPAGRPVTAVRMGVGVSGFPDGAAAATTETAPTP